jgi:hypothetical protein
LDLPGLQFFDQVVGRCCLGTRVLEPVIVVVELDIFASLLYGFLGELKGEEEILGPDGIVPLKKTWKLSEGQEGVKWGCTYNAGGEGSVTVQSFVYHVPWVAAVTPVSDQSVNMVLHDGCQSCGSPGTGSYPIGYLTGPDEVVTADPHSVLFSEVEDIISSCVVEHILLGLCIHELKLVRTSSNFLLSTTLTFIMLAGVISPKFLGLVKILK